MNHNQKATDHQKTLNQPAQLAALACDELPFLVPVPNASDDLESTAKKLRSLADVVTSGNSLALKTELEATPRKHDAESFAKERMSAVELGLYEEWQNNSLQLPEFNWAQNVIPVPPDAHALKTFLQRAAAMDIIWDYQGASAENAAWLASHMAALLPLVKAVTKVLSAQKHLEIHDPLAGLSHGEIAEVQTLQLIMAGTEENVARERERIRELTESINVSQGVLRERLKILKQR